MNCPDCNKPLEKFINMKSVEYFECLTCKNAVTIFRKPVKDVMIPLQMAIDIACKSDRKKDVNDSSK